MFADELRRLNGTPPEVLADAELLELVMPILRADFALVETYAYRAEPPLMCPITALGGTSDPPLTRAHWPHGAAKRSVTSRCACTPGVTSTFRTPVCVRLCCGTWWQIWRLTAMDRSATSRS
jgi:hypothetical protein